MTTHLHITSWALALILFLLALMFYKQGNEKVGKILHMILRLDYLLILYSGGALLGEYFSMNYALGEVIVKSLVGLWIIATLEMILIKKTKGKPVKSLWIQFAIALVIVLVLGFGRLPIGLAFLR